ncbi:serine threonine protein kinase [Ophiostoma piceae UAMH 11346]|uniref:Serine threonine protein kinase n=1 Tax=Ophiostoma piceae (strain UAMH 11346) TaxID=1262450 RepID=S3BZF8_OPHP1|nr:serine threonine protein kinase [Ophiostoma piceae UAMH 11346]
MPFLGVDKLFKRRTEKSKAQEAQPKTDKQDDIRASPIRASWPRRFKILLMLKTTARFYTRLDCCVPISKDLIVKINRNVDSTEAATMEFLAANAPGVPVPRVYCAFVRRGRAYIAMERIQGASILAEYIKLESEDDRARLLAHLKSIMQELRSLLPPSPNRVESCIGGSLYDWRIAHSKSARFGPFGSVRRFHQWLRQDIREEELGDNLDSREKEKIVKMIARQDAEVWPAPVFTHGDLNPSNILAKDGQITGIIDWEFSGWYPSYWEYTSTYIRNYMRAWWQSLLPQFLDPYPEDLTMEATRDIWWGEI